MWAVLSSVARRAKQIRLQKRPEIADTVKIKGQFQQRGGLEGRMSGMGHLVHCQWLASDTLQ